MASENSSESEMTPAERLAWLRERGVQVVSPEERKAGQVAGALKEAEALVSKPLVGGEEGISYVLVPADTSKPLQERTARCSLDWSEKGDRLLEHVKPWFCSGKETVDLELLRQQQQQTLVGTSDAPPLVSDATLLQVAQEAHVEVFPLVHPAESNQYTGINVYLDEIGMLKRLPLNTRMMDYAKRAGYDPPPQFYGDVFLGRVQKQPGSGRTRNQSFVLGPDTDLKAPWLEFAATDNLEHQMHLNRITGSDGQQRQPTVAGADGKAKQEDLFSWTQTEDELEVVVSIPAGATSKQVEVKFHPQSLLVKCNHDDPPVIVSIQLFERVDVDGCTWTIDRSSSQGAAVVVTLEKVESALWPRVRD